MRVTEHSNFDTVRESVRRGREKMENLQLQSSTMKKVNTPSDDPVGSIKILEVRTDKVNSEQYQVNSKLCQTFLSNTDQSLSDLIEYVLRAKEIAISQSSSASATQETRLAVAEEVNQLLNACISAANRRVGDRYLFGGYKTHQPPIDSNGGYKGDDGVMLIEVGKDIFMGMNVPGYEVFNSEPKSSRDYLNFTGINGNEFEDRNKAGSPSNTNLFQELSRFRTALLAGDLDGIRQTLDGLDAAHSRILLVRAKVGSRLQSIENTQQTIDKQLITNAELGSVLEDADMARVMSDLAKEEMVFRSALASSKHLIQPTLLDFLR